MNLNCSYIELTKEMIDMKKLIKNKKGFTLIELIVVIAILAVLAAILVPSILGYVKEARIAANDANARSIYSELSAKVAMGTEANTPGTGSIKKAGNVTCTYIVTNKVLTSITCVSDPAGELKLTTFTP